MDRPTAADIPTDQDRLVEIQRKISRDIAMLSTSIRMTVKYTPAVKLYIDLINAQYDAIAQLRRASRLASTTFPVINWLKNFHPEHDVRQDELVKEHIGICLNWDNFEIDDDDIVSEVKHCKIHGLAVTLDVENPEAFICLYVDTVPQH